MEARCREISVPIVLRTTPSATVNQSRCICSLATIFLQVGLLTHNVRNGDPRNGVWNRNSSRCLMVQHFCIRVCGESRVTGGEMENLLQLCVVRPSSVRLRFLIRCSVVRTPTLRKN